MFLFAGKLHRAKAEVDEILGTCGRNSADDFEHNEELVNYVWVNYICRGEFSNYFRRHTFTDGYKFQSKLKEGKWSLLQNFVTFPSGSIRYNCL